MKPVASVPDRARNGIRFSEVIRGNRLDHMSIVQPLREKLVKSILQNTDLDSSLAANIPHQRSFYLTSSDQTPEEPHAVFALGNFFGSGDVFVKIPWQSLQLTNPLKPLNVSVFRAGMVAHPLERANVASLEIKRDTRGCIKVTARKNSHEAMLLKG